MPLSHDDVPRWYAQQGGHRFRRDNETGEIIECKNYAEFKEKYLNNIKNEDKITSTKLPLKLQLFAKKSGRLQNCNFTEKRICSCNV